MKYTLILGIIALSSCNNMTEGEMQDKRVINQTPKTTEIHSNSFIISEDKTSGWAGLTRLINTDAGTYIVIQHSGRIVMSNYTKDSLEIELLKIELSKYGK